MFRRRRAALGAASPGGRRAADVSPEVVAFRRCLDRVEEAKLALAAAAPGRRTEGAPLADALAAFETGLREADLLMPAWRTDATEASWLLCSSAVQASLARAEALRLGEPPDGYEQLYAMLGDLMQPLEAFAVALDRLRGRPG